MNRFNWTYLADNGKKHHVGLMHGAESGHLLVYCDSNILLIDFSVLEDKTYTFFIDEQLCEISIERKGNQFYYGFEINKTADTPRNRMRKKIERKHLRQTLLMFFGLAIVVATVTFFTVRFKQGETSSLDNYWQTLLQNNGIEGEAKVLSVSADEITYLYIVNGESYSAETSAKDPSIVVIENGMPLEEGDEFVITYVPNNPNLNKIDYTRPTQKQIQRYRERVISKHLTFNPTVDSIHTTCLVDIAMESSGLSGLADIYFQKASPDDNPRNNKNTYGRLVRSIDFQKKIKDRCWN